MNSFNTWVHKLIEFNVLNRWIHRMYEFLYVWIHWCFVRMNSFIIWIHLYKLNEFIYFCTYEFIYSTNSSVQNKWIHLIVVRAKPEPWARSANREGKARAVKANTPPAPTRPHSAAPTGNVHPAAPTRPRPTVLTVRVHPAAPIVRVHPAAPTS